MHFKLPAFRQSLYILFSLVYACLMLSFLLCSDLVCRSYSRDVENPGNNLYVTGLSPRITKKELEKHFSAEGTVGIPCYCFSY
jgi:hypothetical protein